MYGGPIVTVPYRNKIPYNFEKSSRRRSQGVQTIFRAPIHMAVIFATAQLSCSIITAESFVNIPPFFDVVYTLSLGVFLSPSPSLEESSAPPHLVFR